MAIIYEEIRKQAVIELQNALKSIREILGISADKLGAFIGVSKEAVNDLEQNENEMSITQYIAISAVIDSNVRETPDLLTKIKESLKCNEYDENYSFVDEWIKFFPKKGKEIETYNLTDNMLNEYEFVDGYIFRIIAEEYKILINYDSIINENIRQIIDEYSWILKEDKNKIIIPQVVIEMLKNDLYSDDDEKNKKTENILKSISRWNQEEIMEIRGESDDDCMEDILDKIYKIHKTRYKLMVITNNEKTLNKIKELNKIDGFKIAGAYLSNDFKLRLFNEDLNHDNNGLNKEKYDKEIERLFNGDLVYEGWSEMRSLNIKRI